MSVPLVLQVLGWLAVLWLVGIELLIRRDRLHREGLAFRVAGCAAAAVVVASSLTVGTWPVAALGLLWLRTEVFGHRRSARPEREFEPEPELQPAAGAPLALAIRRRSTVGTGAPATTRTRRSGLHVRLPHLPHLPHLGPRVINVLFDIEIAVVLVIALVLFGIWAQQERDGFGQRANSSLCALMGGC